MLLPPYTPRPGSPEESGTFAVLQAELAAHFLRFRADPNLPYTAVVVPSQSVDPVELAKIAGVSRYEERSLFNLMLLRFPRLKVVFVTSRAIDPLVIDYYLHQMRGVPSAHARSRLVLLDCDDGSARPLTQKVLERPLLLDRVRATITDRKMAHLVVFNSTPLERTLSVQLGIPLFACDPALVHLGTKTGSRRIFRQAGLRVPVGHEGLGSVAELAEATAELWAARPDARRVVVKLNDSFSGEGNATLDLAALREQHGEPTSAAERAARVREALPDLRFEAGGQSWAPYSEQFDRMGGVVEEWIEGEQKTSPSVQMRINPLRDVQPISTHDQVLAGPGGQVFVGASFPADPTWRMTIQRHGCEVGKALAAEGVIGRFGVDFLAVRDTPEAEPDIYAVEINLRQGGTTHPFNTLKFITDGSYDPDTGRFFTAQGQERAYFATDVLSAPEYRGILPFDLLDRLVVEGVHFRSDETGVVFHLLGCLSEWGKVGCTAIAPDVAEAHALYDQVVAILDDMSGRRPLDRAAPPPTGRPQRVREP